MATPETFIYGRNPLLDAIVAGKRFDKIIVQKDISGADVAKLKATALAAGITLQTVPREKIERVIGWQQAKTANHQGVLGFLSLVEYYTLDDALHSAFTKGEDPLIVLLDGITDVHNFGAIARSAECLGAHAIVVHQAGSAQINGEAMKASAGALSKILVCREKSLVTAIKFLKANGLKVFGTDMQDATPIDEVDFTMPCVLVMGSEGDGISPQVLKFCDERISIPMLGTTESLNVSVSAGIALYEVMRKRKQSAI
jgi:23S rRNA (guanosine2251-2'-O)-methyltransferase